MRRKLRSRLNGHFMMTALFLAGACTPSADGGGTPGGSSSPGSGGSSSASPGAGGTSGSNPGMSGSTGNPGSVPATAFEPGRVTARRLNAIEYDNTMRDLLGIDFAAAAKPSVKFEFPADEWGDGFFNDADVLTSSPLVVEKYLASAQNGIDLALAANAAGRAKILICDHKAGTDTACMQKIVAEFARRAFRRPVTDDEVKPFLTLFDIAKSKNETGEVGLKLALSAVLVSPDFLFRIEPDATPGLKRALNDFEIASRLSYFIWASMPDEELFTQAKAGALTKTDGIKQQLSRLMADSRASAFSTAMTDQWMHTIALEFAKPDKTFFPKWDETLRPSLAGEVNAFLSPILSGKVSAQELMTAKYVYVNRALATFYGLPNAAAVSADKFDKVMVTDNRRGGVLRQASFLVHSSHPATHSPTVRGKFILDRLLCSPPPPPPANVPLFVPAGLPTGTLRQNLIKLHQGMGGACAACHAIIDPMGFALENYDGVGQWRDKDNGLDVDATGEMPGTGVKFNGAAELSDAIAKDDRFAACMAKQVLTYATGRHLKDADKPLIDDLGKKFAAGGWKFPDLIGLIATSPAMTFRQAE